MNDKSHNGTQLRTAETNQDEKTASGDPQYHVILGGTPKQRDDVVRRLQQENKELIPYDSATTPAPLYRFDGEANWEPDPEKEKTFDDLGRYYALYTFHPEQFEVEIDATISDKEDEEELRLAEEQIVARIKEIAPAADVHLDWLMTGTDINANEGPGISPGGMPYWLPSSLEISRTRNQPQAGDADTAIIVLDTSPDNLYQYAWDPNGRPLDGWADFTGLLLHDTIRYKGFQQTIKKRNIWMDVTEKMREDLCKGVKHHGLMVASVCRDSASAQTKVFLLRVQDENGIGTVHSLTSAMYYVLHLRDKGKLPKNLIFNLSLGLPASVRTGIDAERLLKTIAYVLNAKNTLVVCAAGNSYPPSLLKARVDAEEPGIFYKIEQEMEATLYREGKVSDPQSVRDALKKDYGIIDPDQFQQRLICVGASDRADYTDQRPIDYAPFSKNADLLAPGMDLLLRTCESGESGKPGRDSYLIWSGTSFAVPQVSALAARLLTLGAHIDEIHEILKGTSTPSEGGVLAVDQLPPPDVPRQIDPDRALAELERRMHHKRGRPQSGQGEQNGTQNNGAQERERQAAAGLTHTPGEEQTSA